MLYSGCQLSERKKQTHKPNQSILHNYCCRRRHVGPTEQCTKVPVSPAAAARPARRATPAPDARNWISQNDENLEETPESAEPPTDSHRCLGLSRGAGFVVGSELVSDVYRDLKIVQVHEKVHFFGL